MKYLEDDQLEPGKHYFCITYNNEEIVVPYLGGDEFCQGLDFRHVRFVLYEYELKSKPEYLPD